MRLVVAAAAGARPYVVVTDVTVEDWLNGRYSEFPWIVRCLCDAGFDDEVPPSMLRPGSREEALASHINELRLPGAIWPLHHAAGLFHHTLQHVELLMWPDVGWGGYADYELAGHGQALPE